MDNLSKTTHHNTVSFLCLCHTQGDDSEGSRVRPIALALSEKVPLSSVKFASFYQQQQCFLYSIDILRVFVPLRSNSKNMKHASSKS